MGHAALVHATCKAFSDCGCTLSGLQELRKQWRKIRLAFSYLRLMLDPMNRLIPVLINIIDRYGRIDILVNNAGIGQYGRLIKARPDDWIQLFQTNLLVSIVSPLPYTLI